MPFDAMPKSSDGVPLGAVIKPGNTKPLPLQGSLLGQTDSQNNALAGATTSSAILEAVLNGQAYSALYGQTIGSSATGAYGLSIFNPSNSGKNGLIISIKTMVNYAITITWIYQNTTDPAYSANLSSSILNLKGGGTASVLGSHITASSGAISFPSNNIDQALGPELITNNMPYLLVPGNGINTLVFVGNSQQYAIAVKWIEF